MKPVPRVRTLALLPLAFAILSAPAQGQDPCPRASGPGAEAGWAAYADNDMTEARRRFEAAVAQCDNDQYARTGLGYVNLRDGNVQEAERLWRVVGTAEPKNVDALVGLGLARWRSGDIDAVRGYFSTVLELQPGHPTAVDYLGRIAGADVAVAEPDDRGIQQVGRDGDVARSDLRGSHLVRDVDPDDLEPAQASGDEEPLVLVIDVIDGLQGIEA